MSHKMINCVCGRSVLKKNWKRHATLGKRNQCKLFYLKQQDGKSLTVADQIEFATAPLKDEIKKLKESMTKMKGDFNKTKNYVEKKVGSKEAEKHALEIQKKLEVMIAEEKAARMRAEAWKEEEEASKNRVAALQGATKSMVKAQQSGRPASSSSETINYQKTKADIKAEEFMEFQRWKAQRGSRSGGPPSDSS